MLVAAALGGYFARFGPPEDGSDVPYLIVGAGLVGAWLISLKLLRCYDDRILGYGADEYRRIVGASLKLAAAVAIVAYLADFGVSRGFLGTRFVIGTAGLPGGAVRWRASGCTGPATAARAGPAGRSSSATPATCSSWPTSCAASRTRATRSSAPASRTR